MKQSAKKEPTKIVPGWYADTAGDQYEVGLDRSEKHTGTQSAYIKRVDASPISGDFGNLCQWFDADKYRGNHLKMTAWVKTKIVRGTAHLWVRVDGEGHGNSKRNCFDNMGDRPIKGNTDWTGYEIVVDVPETSTEIYCGCFLMGNGQVWFDDVKIESVSKDVPLTGNFTTAKDRSKRKKSPKNLNFEG